MSKIKMDAVEIGLSIHKGDFSKLRGKSFEMCDNKKKKNHHPGGNMVNKLTLSQRMDQLEDSINRLTKTVSDGFTELRQDIKDINARLDYNNLKKLPESSK